MPGTNGDGGTRRGHIPSQVLVRLKTLWSSFGPNRDRTHRLRGGTSRKTDSEWAAQVATELTATKAENTPGHEDDSKTSIDASWRPEIGFGPTGGAPVAEHTEEGSRSKSDAAPESSKKKKWQRALGNLLIVALIASTVGLGVYLLKPSTVDEDASYAAAVGDVDRLRDYLDSCTDCRHESAARREIELLEQRAIEEAEKNAYDDARGNIDRLRAYRKACEICTFKDQAQSEISLIEKRKKRAELERAEKIAYLRAHGDIESLRAYVRDCEICTSKPEAFAQIRALEEAAQKPEFVSYLNKDIHGGDFDRRDFTDLTSCESACVSDRRCVAYSFDRWNRACFLKSEVRVLRIEPRSTTGVRRNFDMPPISEDPVVMERYRGKYFPGSGYATVTGSFEFCESTCKEAPQCIALTFVKATKRCSLFSETGEYFSKKGMDSGVKLQPVLVSQ